MSIEERNTTYRNDTISDKYELIAQFDDDFEAREFSNDFDNKITYRRLARVLKARTKESLEAQKTLDACIRDKPLLPSMSAKDSLAVFLVRTRYIVSKVIADYELSMCKLEFMNHTEYVSIQQHKLIEEHKMLIDLVGMIYELSMDEVALCEDILLHAPTPLTESWTDAENLRHLNADNDIADKVHEIENKFYDTKTFNEIIRNERNVIIGRSMYTDSYVERMLTLSANRRAVKLAYQKEIELLQTPEPSVDDMIALRIETHTLQNPDNFELPGDLKECDGITWVEQVRKVMTASNVTRLD